MTIQLRAIKEKERGAFRRLARRSLMLPPATGASAAVDALPSENTLCAFEDGELAATYGWWPMTMRFNGMAAPAAGVTFVSTSPVHRRRGYLRRITGRHFEMLYKSAERPIAVLHASMAAVYHRYGYGVVSSQGAYSFHPRQLRFLPLPGLENPPGRLRELGDDGFDRLKELYRRFCRERTGYLHRAKATWAAGSLAPPPAGGELVRIVYEEDGILLGCLIYTAAPCAGEPGRLGQKIEIRDLLWLNARAYRELWRYLSNMDLAVEIEWHRVPPDDPLPHLVEEPRELNSRVRDGMMGRIVDAGQALSCRRYGADGKICFALTDPLCPWNEGAWGMEVSDGRAHLEKTDGECDVTIPADTLAMLFFGQISASRAAAMGRLEALAPEALSAWDAIFQTRHAPFCPDFF
jgi:predicted acetyltransferase